MTRTIQLLIIILLQIAFPCCMTSRNDFPILTGPYLGQEPPGITPIVFAPGIVSTGLYTRDIAMTKDGKEIYFSISDAAITGIFVTKLDNNRWTEPVVATFSGSGSYDFEPHISPDGNKFFFLSGRAPHGSEQKNGWFYQKIWMMDKAGSGWSEPRLADEPVSSEENEFFPSSTNENVLYFTRSGKTGKTGIYRSVFDNGMYLKPEIQQFDIPDTGLLFNAFVSPKEDFLITCALNIDSTNIDQDYYISFKTQQGTWSKLIKLGPEINNPGDNANSPYVSPDGKYLFFSSSRRDPALPKVKSGTSLRNVIKSKSEPGNGSSSIYWVSAKIIENLRPKEVN